VEEAGDKGPEERLLLPDLPQRVLPKRTRDADPVGKMDDVTLKRDSPAPTFLPGNMMVTDDLCKRCKRRKILKEQIGHEGMVVRIAEFKVEGIKTLPQRECPNVMQKTPKEEILKGPFWEPQNLSKTERKVGNLQVVLQKPAIDEVHHLGKTEHKPKERNTATRIFRFFLRSTGDVPILHGH
jgi:hypothetical protein